MNDSRFESYPKYIIQFEDDINKLKLNTSDDSKRLIDLSVLLSKKMEEEVNKVINEIATMIEKETQEEIAKLRNEYSQQRDRRIAQIKQIVSKNYERAVSYVLEAVKGAYK